MQTGPLKPAGYSLIIHTTMQMKTEKYKPDGCGLIIHTII